MSEVIIEYERRFKCPRCGRIWRGNTTQEEFECICHMDCEYCGGEQTCTTKIDRQNLNPTKEYRPKVHDPHPWATNYGPCSVCGHRQARGIEWALPTGDDTNTEP